MSQEKPTIKDVIDKLQKLMERVENLEIKSSQVSANPPLAPSLTKNWNPFKQGI